MNKVEQKRAAKEFVEYWKAAEGSEDRESDHFWYELFKNVLGVANPTRHFDRQKTARGRQIDLFLEDTGVLIENKSRGIDLDKPEQRGKNKDGSPRMVTPYEQAKWYADNITPRSIAPKWLVTCNFDEFRIYDLDEQYPEKTYETITLDEIPEQLHRFTFMIKKENSRAEREKELSVQAAELVGRLYDGLLQQYSNIDTDKNEQRSLNILIVRFVFLLYAEDSDLLQERNAFYNYMRGFNASQTRDALVQLFSVLNTKEEERDPYLNDALKAFPYINGGLFSDEIIIPQFTRDIQLILLIEASKKFDWSDISPTIFGAAFESTLNPETRRAGGMHYTSIENIHKVIDPLFLDDLKSELRDIKALKTKKTRDMKLRLFQKKLASLKIFDPAMGSGNFLTESYIWLRKLENQVLELLNESEDGTQMVLGTGSSANDSIEVNIGQLYGIEINDFAVSVAKTALWIAESQAMDETQEILFQTFEFLPLRSISHLVEGNALRMDWNDICPAEPGVFVCGNPPFRGARWQTTEQKKELKEVFGNVKNVGNIDYVACWYMKAAEYIGDSQVRCAFVSTNSICQGEQVANVWKPLWELGVRIDFAHNTFRWINEANGQAHVYVVVVGFSKLGNKKRLYFHDRPDSEAVELLVKNINAYLSDSPDVFIYNRNKPLCNVPEMGIGSQPIDGGNFIFKDSEKKEFLAKEPAAAKFFHRFMGSQEFLNGGVRNVLWLGNASDEELDNLPLCKERVNAVREFRESSSRTQTRKAALTPTHFGTEIIAERESIIVPEISSERRKYVPMGFVSPDIFCSNRVKLIPDATLYHFGVLHSQLHNAWMRVVCGRLESRYTYSIGIVYNNFIWPHPTDTQRVDIEHCAREVLNIRENYPDKSLAELYDPDKMPTDLLNAHKALDAAVERAYGVDFQGDEEKIVAHLFKLYAEKTGE